MKSVKDAGSAVHEEALFRVFAGNDKIGRSLARGALRAASLSHQPILAHVYQHLEAELFVQKRVQGLMGFLSYNDFLARQNFEDAKFPAINCSNRNGPMAGVGNVLSDDEGLGRLAAQYFIEKGYRKFFVASFPGLRVHDDRVKGFTETLAAAGYPVKHGTSSLKLTGRKITEDQDPIAVRTQNFHPILRDLEPGTAIFVTSDHMAFYVIYCMRIYTPELLDTCGLLGVDNDLHEKWGSWDLLGLSSIEPGFEEIGFRAMNWLIAHPGAAHKAAAAALLERVPPARLVERASTVTAACEDALTNRMIRWAWTRVRQGTAFSMGDLAQAHGITPKMLQRWFSTHAGSSANELMVKLRMDYAAELLETTQASLHEIAGRTGYRHQSAFSSAFLKARGCTPRDWRAQAGQQPSVIQTPIISSAGVI